jgi:hypothetical protein
VRSRSGVAIKIEMDRCCFVEDGIVWARPQLASFFGLCNDILVKLGAISVLTSVCVDCSCSGGRLEGDEDAC